MEGKDADGKPVVSGLYVNKLFSERLILIDLKSDSYEMINGVLAKTTLKGRISEKIMQYLEGYQQTDIQAYINHNQEKVDFFKSKLEQLSQSEEPKIPLGCPGPYSGH